MQRTPGALVLPPFQLMQPQTFCPEPSALALGSRTQNSLMSGRNVLKKLRWQERSCLGVNRLTWANQRGEVSFPPPTTTMSSSYILPKFHAHRSRSVSPSPRALLSFSRTDRGTARLLRLPTRFLTPHLTHHQRNSTICGATERRSLPAVTPAHICCATHTAARQWLTAMQCSLGNVQVRWDLSM